jgi:hypothetical protein
MLQIQALGALTARRRLPCLVPRPSMVPTLPRRKVDLHSRILDWYTSPYTSLQHGCSIQPTNFLSLDTQSPCVRSLPTSFCFRHQIPIGVHQTKMFASGAHGHILPLKVEFLGPATFPQKQQPRTLNGPVSQVAEAGEVEGSRGKRMGEVVANCG